MPGELQVLRAHLVADQLGKSQALSVVRVLLRDEHGITGEQVVEMALPALEFPALVIDVRHRVMMDRQEQVGAPLVGDRDAPGKARPCLALRHHQERFGKTVRLEPLFDALAEVEVEFELGDIARAHGAIGFLGVANIEDDAEFRAVASCGGGLGRGSGGIIRRRGLSGADHRQRR